MAENPMSVINMLNPLKKSLIPTDNMIVYALEISAVTRPARVSITIFSFLNLLPIAIDKSPLKKAE